MQELIEKIIDKLNSKKAYFQGFYKCEGKTEHDADLNKVTQLAFDDAVEVVKQVSAEYKNGWIPCSERLPEEPFGCLVTVIDTNPVTMEDFENILPYFVGYDGEQWNDADGEQLCLEVIAWQPLPEPYQPNICISANCTFNDGEECPAAEGCAGFEQKKQTNADRIRFMSDEELAEFILKNCDNPISEVNEDMCDFCDNSEGESECDDESCKRAIVKWLQSEVEE